MSVLGYFHLRNPKSMTQLDATHPQNGSENDSLIGRCKGMIPRMDPMRAVGLQGLAVETSLVTCKYSSSTLLLEEIYNYQEGETIPNKNTS